MSQENVGIVRRMYEAFHGGHAERALAYFDPVVAVDASRRVDGEQGRGREDLVRIISSWTGAFEEWREEIETIRDVGGRVYVAATQRGRGKASGLQIETRYAVLYEVQARGVKAALARIGGRFAQRPFALHSGGGHWRRDGRNRPPRLDLPRRRV